MSTFRSDRGKHDHTVMHKMMIVYVFDRRLDGQGQTLLTPVHSSTVCSSRFCGAASPFCLISTGQDLLRGTRTWASEEADAEEHPWTEVTSASLKIDEVGPCFSRCKKQVALWDSLHLSKIWRIEWQCSWWPYSSFLLNWNGLSQMSAGLLHKNIHGLSAPVHEKSNEHRFWFRWRIVLLFNNGQIIHVYPPRKSLRKLAVAHLIPPVIHPWPQSWPRFSPYTPPPQPTPCSWSHHAVATKVSLQSYP